jgi:hypothetical protein
MWKIVQALRRSCKCKKRKTGTKKRLAKRSQKGGYKVGTIKKRTHS